MSNKAYRNIFIAGSLFFAVILVYLTIDSLKQVDLRSPEVTANVDAGKHVWHKYNCIGCHTILGNGAYFAPDLTKVVVNKPREFIIKLLMDPKAAGSKATMPKLGITEQEANDMWVFLDWISKVDTNGWPPKPIMKPETNVVAGGGADLFQKQNCAACHAVNGMGGSVGPDLSHVGSHRDAAWLATHFKNPASVVPGSSMPSFGHLSEAELRSLVDYMLSLK